MTRSKLISRIVYHATRLSDDRLAWLARLLLARLTPEGQAMQNSTPSLEGIFAGCCAGLNADEARELSRLLRRLVDSLG